MSEQQQPASSERVIASFADYSGMIEALRARAIERRIAIGSPEVAAVTGLTDHYLAKLLAPNMASPRRLGMISMGPVLAVLGARLQLIEDPESLKRYADRLPKRKGAHNGAITFTVSRQHMRKLGKKGAQSRWDAARKMLAMKAKRAAARNASLTPARRREIAKMAAAARWKKAPVNSP